jgi:hypothetical protein
MNGVAAQKLKDRRVLPPAYGRAITHVDGDDQHLAIVDAVMMSLANGMGPPCCEEHGTTWMWL